MGKLIHNEFYTNFDVERYQGSGPESAGDNIRTPFQVDRDRIIFSYAFRRLQSKTQVFQSGEYDYYRTRLTHTIEVARLSRSIAEYLNVTEAGDFGPNFFIDPDLCEAAGLAHDLGHPPYGHIGERTLNKVMGPHGGFEGNAQTLRILTDILYESGPRGMRPTRATLASVMKYPLLQRECTTEETITQQDGTQRTQKVYPYNHFLYDAQEPVRTFTLGEDAAAALTKDAPALKTLDALKSIECQIMDWADDAAYSLHDILDGLQTGFLTRRRIERWAERTNIQPAEEKLLADLIEATYKGNMEARFGSKLGYFIRSGKLQPCTPPPGAPNSNRYKFNYLIDEAAETECKFYKKVMQGVVFDAERLQQAQHRSNRSISKMFDSLYWHYVKNPEKGLRLLPDPISSRILDAQTTSEKARMLCDYLSALTDLAAPKLYRRLFDPDFGALEEFR